MNAMSERLAEIKRELVARIIFKVMVHPTNDWLLPVYEGELADCYDAADDILTVLKPTEG